MMSGPSPTARARTRAPLYVTLSSIPPRFAHLDRVLGHLLDQSEPAERVLLYIPRRYRRFPDWDGSLPVVPQGVEIRQVSEDLGPATKVLCAAREFAGQTVDLLFCDDDRQYRRDWVARFRALREVHPESALCLIGRHAETMAPSTGAGRIPPRAVRRWRLTDWRFQLHFLWRQARAGRNWRAVPAPHRRVYKRSGQIDIFEGCGGVLVRPGMFDPVAYEIPPVLWAVDDVWLSGMVTRLGVPIWLEANQTDPDETEADRLSPLVYARIDDTGRDEANALAVRHMQQTYGIWL